VAPIFPTEFICFIPGHLFPHNKIEHPMVRL
jgi:hypothetical protein